MSHCEDKNGDGLCDVCSAPSISGVLQVCPLPIDHKKYAEALRRHLEPKPDIKLPVMPDAGTPRLGDWAEEQLSSIGVTKDRYKDIKGKFGLPKTCGCSNRQEWLNQVSAWWAEERKMKNRLKRLFIGCVGYARSFVPNAPIKVEQPAAKEVGLVKVPKPIRESHPPQIPHERSSASKVGVGLVMVGERRPLKQPQLQN